MIRAVSAFYQKMRLQVDMICAERKLGTDHFAIRRYFGKISRGLLYGGVCLSVGPSKTFKVLRPHSPTSRSMPSIYASICEQCYPFALCTENWPASLYDLPRTVPVPFMTCKRSYANFISGASNATNGCGNTWLLPHTQPPGCVANGNCRVTVSPFARRWP
jgi:hypothetical protein